nr:Gag-Pol polyprotein [Tanacetum cinerariifolium]
MKVKESLNVTFDETSSPPNTSPLKDDYLVKEEAIEVLGIVHRCLHQDDILNGLRYVDTRPNGEASRKCILSGPYKPTTVLVQAVDATDDSPAVPEHTTVETPMNMSPENKAYFLTKKEAIHLNLTRIRDDIYSTVDACQTTQEMWEAIERFVTIVKQQHKLDEVSYHKLFDILKQYQHEVNELRAEMLAKNANPLALVATAQADRDQYYQTSRGHDPEQAQRDKDMQKNLALITKYFKKIYKPTNNNLRTSSNSKNKNVDTTPQFKNDNQLGQFGNQRTINVVADRENVGSKVVKQSGIQCFNYKEYGHFGKEYGKPKRVKDSAYHKEKILLCKQAEQAYYSCKAKIQEVPTVDSGTDSELVEQSEQVEFEKYKAFNDHTIDYEKLEHLKAQLQDKNIAISELKKLIEKGKGKYVDTKFDRPSVVRQPNAQQIPKPSVLAKKAVSNTNVLKPRMYRIDKRTTHTRAPQLPETVRNTNPHVSTSTGVNHKPNVGRPQLKSNQSRDKVLPNNSQVKVKKTQSEFHPRIPSVSNKMKSVNACKDSLNSRTLNANAVCATCNKCLVDSNHFACVTKMLNDMHARTKKHNISLYNSSYSLLTLDARICANSWLWRFGLRKCHNQHVYYVKGLNHNLFLVGQFCDADLEVAFRKSTCFVRDLQEEGIEHQTSTTRTPEQNGIVERQNRTLVKAARMMISASQHPLFFEEKRDQCILVGYSTQSKGYRVYNKRTRMIVESIHIRFDEIKAVSETSVANDTLSLVPQRQKASNYDNPDPIPQ